MCYLAAEGGRHPRRELAELLWPQSDEQHARMDLRSTLARLRKTLGEESVRGGEEADLFLVIEGDLLGLELGGIYLDLKALEAAVSLSRTETSPAGGRSAQEDDAVVRRDLIGSLEGTWEQQLREGKE